MHLPGGSTDSWPEFFLPYRDNVQFKSQRRALSFKRSLVNNLNKCESTDALNTVLNIQERSKKTKQKNLLIRQNKHHRFLRMPDVSSEGPAVRLSSQTESCGIVVSWSPSLCCVSCDLTCSSWVQFEGSKHCRGLTWAQRSRDISFSLCNKQFLNLLFSLKTTVVGPSLNVCLDLFHIIRTRPPPHSYATSHLLHQRWRGGFKMYED